MPAIHLDRLRKQVANLAQHFDDPPRFSKSLQELFEAYADRTQRPGHAGEPPPLIKPYNVPQQILRIIITEITTQVYIDSDAALELCDHLWKDTYLESRLLSIRLLGIIKLADPNPILLRISNWIDEDLDEALLNSILNDGLLTIRMTDPDMILTMIDDWFSSQEDFQIKVGLLALKYLIGNSVFEDTSVIFRLLNPYIRKTHKQFKPEMLEILRILAKHYPKETAYHFRMVMESSNSDDAAWFIRHCLQDFPNETRNSLSIY